MNDEGKVPQEPAAQVVPSGAAARAVAVFAEHARITVVANTATVYFMQTPAVTEEEMRTFVAKAIADAKNGDVPTVRIEADAASKVIMSVQTLVGLRDAINRVLRGIEAKASEGDHDRVE